MNNKISNIIVFTTLLALVAILFMTGIRATPQNPAIISNTTDTGPTIPSYSRADEGGTITTLLFNVTAQTQAWKGYVGNVTGTLALQDSSNYTLYDWHYSTITGEVYASRASSITWADINCTDGTVLASEYSAINMGYSDIDSINATFNETTHQNLTVGNIWVENNTCMAAYMYNGSRQDPSTDAFFQEVLLDDDSNLVYTTILEQDKTGYNGYTYDFQMIVADSDASATQTTYYFFAELG